MIKCNDGSIEVVGPRKEVLAELGMIMSTFLYEGFCDTKELLTLLAVASKIDKDGIYAECVKHAEVYKKKVELMEVDE